MLISQSELSLKIQEILKSSDLKKTTNNIIINTVQNALGIDLSDQKPFLRHQIDRFLQSRYDLDDDCDVTGVVANVGGVNDHVFDSEDDNDDDDDDDDDGFFGIRGPGGSSSGNSNSNSNRNVGGKLKDVDGLDRRARQNKDKIKRTCVSGKYCDLSPKLQNFIGASHMTRTEIVRHLWTYVKERNLQDPNDGKTIICDEILRDLFEVDIINILQINKALTKHIWPQVKQLKRDKLVKQEKEEGDFLPSVKLLSKDKPRKKKRAKDPCEDETKEMSEKKVLSGFLAPLPLSDTLKRFLGTGEVALTRAIAIRRVWQYINHKKLQDPFDKKTIICDEKLRELFNVDSFDGFTVSKLLSPHFVKRSSSTFILRQPKREILD